MKYLLATFLCFTAAVGYTQFKEDNVKYKTVFPKDLCKTLQAHPGFVLLDVRSDGEFYDSSSMAPSLNIGHIENAMHIDIRQLPARWKELSAYKDKPLFVYCSHSQRSRRASRLLADSGFANVFNVNGGLTNFYAQGITDDPCANYTIKTNVPYKIVSPKQLMDDLKKGTPYFIIDLRSDSVFKGTIANEQQKLEGRFSNANNLPFEKITTNSFALPDKPILLVDEDGSESPVVAKMLAEKGFKNVSILFDGMEEWMDYITNTNEKPWIQWITYSDFKMISPDDFYKMQKSNKPFSVVDVRPNDQYNNQSKNYWQNVGQVKKAINIPLNDFEHVSLLPADKTIPIIVLGFNNEQDVFMTASWFKKNGYKNVSVLQGGIWNLRWAAHNLKNKMYLADLVTNVPPENE